MLEIERFVIDTGSGKECEIRKKSCAGTIQLPIQIFATQSIYLFSAPHLPNQDTALTMTLIDVHLQQSTHLQQSSYQIRRPDLCCFVFSLSPPFSLSAFLPVFLSRMPSFTHYSFSFSRCLYFPLFQCPKPSTSATACNNDVLTP